MKKKFPLSSKKIYRLIPVTLIALYVVALGSDRIYGYYHKPQHMPDSLFLSTGDVIFRMSSFYLADSDYPEYGCLPGHIGIVMYDTVISCHTNGLEYVIIAESSLFSKRKKKILGKVRIEAGNDNFGHGFGRRFLIKTSFDETEKNKMRKFILHNLDKPYNLLAIKSDTTSYNCSSLVWHSIKQATDVDTDANGGKYVLPSDILAYYSKKKKTQIIRF